MVPSRSQSSDHSQIADLSVVELTMSISVAAGLSVVGFSSLSLSHPDIMTISNKSIC